MRGVVMTSPDCPSGTDRVAEAVRQLAHAGIIVNLQGDEPEIDPRRSTSLSTARGQPGCRMATLATPIREREKLEDPSCVKVVFDAAGRALYFSRSPIPHAREWDEDLLAAEPPAFYQHIGMYAYRRELLLQLASLPPWAGTSRSRSSSNSASWSKAKRDPGVVVDQPTRGIDTPADYAAFLQRRKAG